MHLPNPHFGHPPTAWRLALLGLLPAMSACSVDYGVATIDDAVPQLWELLHGADTDPEPLDILVNDAGDISALGELHSVSDPPIDVRLDAAFQRNHWGESTTRCQLQLSFSLPNEAEPEEVEEPEPDPEPTLEIARPEVPGTCAFTESDPDETGGGEGGGPDNWYVSGSLSGPEEIRLEGELTHWVLELVYAEDGKLRYELADCSVDTFPFGQALDLVVPSTENDLDAFQVDDAIAVGSEVVFAWPDGEEFDGSGRYKLPASEPLALHWDTPDGDPVLADGELPTSSWELRIHNAESSGSTYQWLYCMPDAEGFMELSAEDLGQLHFNAATDEETVKTNLDLHLSTQAPQWETPWARSMQVRTTISDGGGLYLDPGP